MQDFRGLKVWQKSHSLTLSVYKITTTFPSEEKFGLTRQVRKASASIPANIAEGCGRQSDKELGRFLGIAMGSANELEYHLLLARDLEFLDDTDYNELNSRVIEIERMLVSFIQKLKA